MAQWRHMAAESLTEPTHFLNECLLTINGVLRHSHQSNFIGNAQVNYHWYPLDDYEFKITPPHHSEDNELIEHGPVKA